MDQSASRTGSTVMTFARSGIARAPVSIGLLVVLWGLAIATGSTRSGPPHDVKSQVALGFSTMSEGRLWSLWTSGLFAANLVSYVVASVAILAIAAPVEYRIGTRRFAIAALVTQGVGALSALAVAWLASAVPNSWGLELRGHLVVGPLTWVVGTLMTATAVMPTLWRRRIRVVLLVIVLTAALSAGHLEDLTRLTAAVTGLLLGPALFGRAARGPSLGGTLRERRTLVSLVVAASVLGPIVAAFSPHAAGPLSALRWLFEQAPYSPRELVEICSQPALHDECRVGQQALRLSGVGPVVLNLMPSVVLLVAAEGLRRGRRAAWLLAVGAQVILIAFAAASVLVRITEQSETRQVLYGAHRHQWVYADLTPLLVFLAVLALLVFTRQFFDVRAEKGTYVRVWLGMFAVTALASAAYVLLGSLSDGFERDPGMGTLLLDAPRRLLPPAFLPFFEPPILPVTWSATLLFEWVGVVVWAAFSILMLVSFLSRPAGEDPGGQQRVRELLHSPGGGSLSWMTSWSGNRYWFSEDGRHAVAYRVYSGVALTATDPLGGPDGLAEAVDQFAIFCVGNGWTPCFYSVGATTADIGRRHGWSCLQVAEETLIDLGDLEFKGKRFQDVRTALNRAGKSGIEARWDTFADAPLSIREQITAISEAWVADKGLPEMGFTLGGLAELQDREVRLLLAVDQENVVHGVTSWMPVYRDGEIVGLTLDFMRRRADGFRPAMEFLIASAALRAQDEGLEFLSLSGAPLASVDDGSGMATGPLDSMLDLLGRTLEPVYGFRSLLAFKSKFAPRYRPMYMVFPDSAALPAIGVAVSRAYLPHVSLDEGRRLLTHLIRR